MTRAVQETESESAAQQVAAIPATVLAVPASLHASLMARLDRLGSAKEVAQNGAVIGREYSHALIVAVARKPKVELISVLDVSWRPGCCSGRDCRRMQPRMPMSTSATEPRVTRLQACAESAEVARVQTAPLPGRVPGFFAPVRSAIVALDTLKNLPKFRVRKEAHCSISIQEGRHRHALSAA
jgi:hypothetical protein